MNKFPMFSSENRGSCLFNATGSKESQEASTGFQVWGLQQLFSFTSAFLSSDWFCLHQVPWFWFGFTFSILLCLPSFLLCLSFYLFRGSLVILLFQFHFATPVMLGSKTSCLIAVQYPAGHFPSHIREKFASYLPCSFKFSEERTRRDMELLTLLANGPWKCLERDTEGSPHCFMSAVSMPQSQDCQLTSFHQPNIDRCMWMLLWKHSSQGLEGSANILGCC